MFSDSTSPVVGLGCFPYNDRHLSSTCCVAAPCLCLLVCHTELECRETGTREQGVEPRARWPALKACWLWSVVSPSPLLSRWWRLKHLAQALAHSRCSVNALFGITRTWAAILAQGTLDTSLSLPEPWFAHLENGLTAGCVSCTSAGTAPSTQRATTQPPGWRAWVRSSLPWQGGSVLPRSLAGQGAVLPSDCDTPPPHL